MKQTGVERVGGLRDWNATIEGNVSSTAASTFMSLIVSATSTALAAGTTALILRHAGMGTSIAFLGAGIITDFSTSAPVDGVQTFSATVAGRGGALRYAIQ